MKCFSVFDVKANMFGVPFFAVSVGVASRMFADLVVDSRSTIYRYPADFALYEIGDFNETSGLFTSLDRPNHVCNASEFVANPPVALDHFVDVNEMV